MSNDSMEFQELEIEEILEEANARLAPNQREFTHEEVKTLVLEHGKYINHKQTVLEDFEKSKTPLFLIIKLSKTPHLLRTTPSSGGDLKR